MISVEECLQDHGLELATENTDLISLTKEHEEAFDNIQQMELNDKEIETTEAIKYPGITLDEQMSFGEHIGKAVEEVHVTTMAWARGRGGQGGSRALKI